MNMMAFIQGAVRENFEMFCFMIILVMSIIFRKLATLP